MHVTPIPAVILAGGQADEALARAAGVRHKALVPVLGRPMVLHVASALAACDCVSEVLLAGPPEVADVVPGARPLGNADSFLGNVLAGTSACSGAPRCLLVTCDIPFVTAEALTAFVRLAWERDVDLAYPIVALHHCAQRFPGMARTSLRLREGRFTGGNAVLVRPQFLTRNAALIEAAFAARKEPIRLAGMIGWDLILRVLLSFAIPKSLPLALLEQRVGRLVGGQVAAIPLPYPEIGADIDKPQDLVAATE